MKSATLLVSEQSVPVHKEYVKGWKHSGSELVESSMNHDSIEIVYGSPFYSKKSSWLGGNVAGVRSSFPQTVTRSLNNNGLLVTYSVEALMQAVSWNPYEVS